MARVKGKNTKPEILVRRALHKLGYRFRLHRRDMPGKPDIVLPKYKTVIFVHGCFWHRHPGCSKASTPKTRVEFWEEKFAANVARDERNLVGIDLLGWQALVVWECETKDLEALSSRLSMAIKKLGSVDGETEQLV